MFFAYRYFERFSDNRITALSAVPDDAAFVFEFSRFPSTWNHFSNTNLVWSDLLTAGYVKNLNQQITFADSLFSHQKNFQLIYNSAPLIFSLHPQTSSSAFFLCWQTPRTISAQAFREQLNTWEGIRITEEKTSKKNTIFQLEISQLGNWYVSVQHNLLLASNSLPVMEESLRKLQQDEASVNNKKLTHLKSLSGNSTDVRMYVNFDQARRIFANDISADGLKWMGGQSPAQWTEADLITQPSGFSFQGYSLIDSNAALGVARGQQQATITATTYIPHKAAGFIHISTTDYDAWFSNLQKDEHHRTLSEEVAENCQCDIKSAFGNWLGDEAVVFYLANKHSELSKFALLKTSGLANPIGLLAKEQSDTLLSSERIKPLKAYDMAEAALGKLFRFEGEAFFTELNDYILIGTDSSLFGDIKNWAESGRTLAFDDEYLRFSADYLQLKSHFLFYSNLNSFFSIIRHGIKQETGERINKNQELMQKFSALAWQGSMINNSLLYHNINVVYNAQAQLKSNLLWQTKLEHEVQRRAWFSKNHRTNTQEILVQDTQNKLYRISATGKILWSRQLEGAIIGDIKQVDVFNNGRYQTLLVCSNWLYIIDILGNNVTGFPTKLPASATGSPAVLDYEKKKDYRFVVPCGNTLYNFDKTGKAVDGWEFQAAAADIETTPVHFVIEGKDYICVNDKAGNIYLVDRRGKIRHHVSKQVPKNTVPKFVKGKMLSTSRLFYADSSNRIMQLFFDGKVASFIEDSTLYSNLFKPVTQNDEFLYLAVPGQQRVEFYGADQKAMELLSLGFSKVDELNIFQQNGKRTITILDKQAGEIFISIKTGSTEKTHVFEGKTPPQVLDMNNDGILNVLTTFGKNVRVYNAQ